MNKKPPSNKLLIILLSFLFIFTALIGLRYFLGLKTLNDHQEYLAGLERIFYEQNQPTLTSPTIKTTDPRLGQTETAENLIIMFGDFQCPHCGDAFDSLVGLNKKYPDDVLIIWKDTANYLHPEANSAAVAARCAQKQNKFWEYATYLFTNQANLNTELYPAIAKELNLKMDQFSQCFNNQETLNLVNDGYEEAMALKIEATPYLFVNNLPISGAVSQSELEVLINKK